MEEEESEDYCFICKDGGLLIVCDYEHCLKAYHPECVGMDATFLETDNQWICRCHSCHVCNKKSNFKCICCPYSLCPSCAKVDGFTILKEEIGLCNSCFKLAYLAENNIDKDSDGVKMDFTDRETYECLFKEYWEIMKTNECVTDKDLQMAGVFGRRRKYCHKAAASDKLVESEDLTSDIDYTDYNCSSGIKKRKGNSLAKKKAAKTIKLKHRRFASWGSEQLLHFLTNIGQETDKPISQIDVCDIIYNYIQKKALIHPKKRKKVLCDEKLYALFGRKVVNRLKISDMLDKHFAENQLSEEEVFWDLSPNDNVPESAKRRFKSSVNIFESEFKSWKEKDNNPQYSFASITGDNIKLVYLKRSLVEQFLQNPDTFEDKVKNSFVRVKPAPKARNWCFQLMLITGVERMSENYRTRKIVTDFVLLVSDEIRSIRISMLSDDEFSEEECDSLRLKVNQGLIKRPRVVELTRKATSLHEDITNHWIETELVRLQNLMDRANEKGWRRELFEYVDRKELLETPEERSRLLNQHPKVIVDEDIEAESIPCCHEDAEVGSKDDVFEAAPGRPQKQGRRDSSEMQLPLQTPSGLVEDHSGPEKLQDKLEATGSTVTDVIAPSEETELPLQSPSLLVDDPSEPEKLEVKLEATRSIVTDAIVPFQASRSVEDPSEPENLEGKLEATWGIVTDAIVPFEEILPLQSASSIVVNPSGPENMQGSKEFDQQDDNIDLDGIDEELGVILLK